MKKRDLYWAVSSIAASMILLVLALTKVNSSLLCSLAGGLLGHGIAQLYRYLKWTRPKNAERYREKLELEQIDLQDERKAQLRNKAGNCAWLLGLVVCLLGSFLLAVLMEFGVMEENLLLIALPFGYAIFQYIAGALFYRWLEKRC